MTLLTLLSQPPPYHQTLLVAAREHIESQPAVSLVVAFMAAEILTEQVISAAFANRGIPDLERPVTSLVSGNSLTNDKNRKLYEALTGDVIHEAEFWVDFKNLGSLRNDAVHAGTKISIDEARLACWTIHKILDHLETTRRRLVQA